MSDLQAAHRPIVGWEHFSHTADIGVRGFGPTPAAAFEQAALAMTSVVAALDSILGEQMVEVRCQAPDLELLLVDWLNAIIFQMATRKMLFGEFHVSIVDNVLHGRARGERISASRHHPAAEVKGATLSELHVTHSDDGLWYAQCVVDV
jgi:SHS2 domain-containing protein